MLAHDAAPDVQRRHAEGDHLQRIALCTICLTENTAHTIVPVKVPVLTGGRAHAIEVAEELLQVRRQCLEAFALPEGVV